jgi:hypothetical protein
MNAILAGSTLSKDKIDQAFECWPESYFGPTDLQKNKNIHKLLQNNANGDANAKTHLEYMRIIARFIADNYPALSHTSPGHSERHDKYLIFGVRQGKGKKITGTSNIIVIKIRNKETSLAEGLGIYIGIGDKSELALSLPVVEVSECIKTFEGEMQGDGSRKLKEWLVGANEAAIKQEKHPPFLPYETRLPNNDQEDNGRPPVTYQSDMSLKKNIILYGPPGTGKTYAITMLALAPFSDREISEHFSSEDRDVCRSALDRYPEELQETPDQDEATSLSSVYNKLVAEGAIRFVTFHQTFSYEDFVEGLTAKVTTNDRSGNGTVSYHIRSGVLKTIAASAICSWLGEQRPATDQNGDIVNIADILNRCTEAVLRPASPINENAGDTQKTRLSEPVPYVLIIDEINRGNVAKIFGEMITLIEESKRAKRGSDVDYAKGDQPTGVRLPLSGDTFYLPPNLYIIGTMNTADRSLVGMDMAMRRRFDFIELVPNPETLRAIVIEIQNGQTKTTLNLGDFLEILNERIAAKDTRDHAVGHAYLLEIEKMKPEGRFGGLQRIMRNKIIPQLRENFIGRQDDLREILSKDNNRTQSLVDEHGRPSENLNNLACYPGATTDEGKSRG